MSEYNSMPSRNQLNIENEKLQSSQHVNI